MVTSNIICLSTSHASCVRYHTRLKFFHRITYEVPLNATIRQEYVKCGDPDCQNSHGPYLYAGWEIVKITHSIRSIDR